MHNAETMTSIELLTDAELVADCLAGNREAFGRIVERYQRLPSPLPLGWQRGESGAVPRCAGSSPCDGFLIY